MKAMVCPRYGSPDVLELREVPEPNVADDKVLVRVHAAAVGPHDWHLMRGEPYLVRLMGYGLRKPRVAIPGLDLAGRVEAVGKDVTGFRPGDEVFGACKGAFAELVSADEKNLAPKPANLTFEQAAAVPVSAVTALQGLRDRGRLQRGQRVLVVGASGGVGTFAVQIAKSLGADVTGVCSGRNVEMVRALGADRVVDYIQEDFAQGGQRYDLILDTVGSRALSDCRRALTPAGCLVLVGGKGGPWLGGLERTFGALLLSPFVRQRLLPFLAKMTKNDLLVLKELLEAGKLTPVIDSRYPLSELADALRHSEAGHARGKIVVTL